MRKFCKKYINIYKIFFFLLVLQFIKILNNNNYLVKKEVSVISSEYKLTTDKKEFNVIRTNINLATEISHTSGESVRVYNETKDNENFFLYKPSFIKHSYKSYDYQRKRNINKKIYKILEYTKIGGQQKACHMNFPGLPHNNSAPNFKYLDKCEYKNCIFTCDKSQASTADAFFFHLTDVHSELVKNRLAKEKLFSYRNPDQVWIFWNDEANVVSEKMNEFKFNWTMSFKTKSEASYGAYGYYSTSDNVVDSKLFLEDLHEEFNKRKNITLWFVSNCASKTRNKFVTDLSIKTDVHIYGKCNNHLKKLNPKVPPTSFKSEKLARDSEAELAVLKGHKFFLALENQNCSDYITEKFWRSLSFGIIPVVLTPSRESYQKVAPKDSFIHIEDFDNDHEKLGDYLKSVSSDFLLYSKHLKWRINSKSNFDPLSVEQIRFCELCYRLNKMQEVGYYNSISNFFNNDCKRK